MTLPAAFATISLNNVNVELGRAGTTPVSLNDADVRTLFGVGGSGTAVSLHDGHGKTLYVPPSPSAYGFYFVDYGSTSGFGFSVSDTIPYTDIYLDLIWNSSGEPPGCQYIGTTNASGYMSYAAVIYHTDPYWYPASRTNQIAIRMSSTIGPVIGGGYFAS